MSIFVIITLALILGKILCMVYNKMPTDVLGLLIITILLVTTTLSEEEAISCFSSTSVVLVGVLSVVMAGLIHSGVLTWIVRHVLGEPKTHSKTLLRLFFPVVVLSAFINNLAVVQLFISVVKMWGKKLRIAPSRLLIPLSYASTLGGLCTLIGNTPNLMVAEFYMKQTGEQMSIFAPLIPGLFCTITGLITIIVFHKFIPLRKSPEESFESSADYTVELLVPTDCPHVGDTVEEANLYQVSGGQLIEIVRFDREIISPVPKDEFILGGDRLVYSGQINSILELRESHGLVNATHHVFNVKDVAKNRKLQMASLDANSPLVGNTMANSDFEDENDVVLVAVAREGERLTEIPREVELRPGDTLLFEGSKLRPEYFTDNLNFFDSVPLPQNNQRTLISSLIMLGMVLLAACNILPLLQSCFLAALLMFVTRCFSIEQLQRSINWKLLMVFAGAVCLGRAIDATGIAQFMAESVLNICGTNAQLSLFVICLTATLITEFISNNTAAAVFAPIALSVANSLGANPMTFVIALMLSVSCSFATPIASETNTIIYGPGGYKFTDYIRIGIIMNIVMLISILFIVNIVFPIYP
ncbi:MAG: anion permease [Bacteroidaceae bacterium]|nr:SLC13 family permease [Candidatus Minthousia equi]MCQ2247127.1 anion permease [Bacteroidaceae bacterium]